MVLVDRNGMKTMDQVTVGAADGDRTSYRMLRVPN